MIVYKSKSRLVFQIFNYSFLIFFSLLIIVPFINIIAVSFSGFDAIIAGKVKLWPVDFTTSGYMNIFTNSTMWRAVLVTIYVTITNTFLTIIIALMAGYALSHKSMKFKKFFIYFFMVIMYFNGGMIPFYLVVNKLGLYNTAYALVLPFVINVFYIIVFRNSIMQLPQDLIDAAEIDGAGVFLTLFNVVVPLLTPMIAAFTIFSAVGNWNSWYNVLLFARDRELWTLQYKLREILVNLEIISDYQSVFAVRTLHPENLKMAAIIFCILPIMLLYPLLQRFFIHGVIVGAVKG
ncbi:MAG: ABC transporter permease [Clostridiales bacterium GWC2_40_7]|nr:MAG: ABC transporter permease [Clostridiales bacterium GWC2_40_7]